MNLLETRFQDAKGHCLYFPYNGDKKHLFCNLDSLWKCKEIKGELKKDLEYALCYFYFVEVLPIIEYAELVAKKKNNLGWYLWYSPKDETPKLVQGG